MPTNRPTPDGPANPAKPENLANSENSENPENPDERGTRRGNIELYPRPAEPTFDLDNVTIVHYELLSKKTLRELDKSDAIVVVPVALMEVHGEFLPIGTDYLESVGWANYYVPDVLRERRPDRHYTVVLFPPVPLGTGGLRGMRGTVNLDHRRTFRRALLEIVDGIVFAGFTRVLLCTAHHGNTHGTILEEVAHKIGHKYRDRDVRVGSPVNFFVQRAYVATDKAYWDAIAEKVGEPPLTDADFYAIRNDHHSALMETSFMQAINPAWVDPLYKGCPEHLEGIDHSIKSLLSKRWAHLGGPDGCGYNGDPSRVDDRDWFKLYDEVIRSLTVEMIDALYAPDPAEFRARYLDSFQWRVKLLKTDLKWWFLGPLLAYGVALPWVSFFLPEAARPPFVLWFSVAVAIYLGVAFAYLVGDTKRVIGTLAQEKH